MKMGFSVHSASASLPFVQSFVTGLQPGSHGDVVMLLPEDALYRLRVGTTTILSGLGIS